MVILGVANAVCSCLIGCAQRRLHREALIAIGCVLHSALIIFLLVWIPDRHLLSVFFVLSALWGFCEAIWQTQSNGSFLPRDAMLARYIMWPCVCPSVTSPSSIKAAKRRITQTTPYDSTGTLVLWRQNNILAKLQRCHSQRESGGRLGTGRQVPRVLLCFFIQRESLCYVRHWYVIGTDEQQLPEISHWTDK